LALSRSRRVFPPLLPARAWARAAFALAAVIASFVAELALCRAAGADAQPAIVAALIALSLSARPRPRGPRAHPLLHAAAPAAIAPAAAGFGWLLHAAPAVGAMAFTATMALTVWVRNVGGFAQTLGRLAALPLLAILIVPPPVTRAAGGPIVDIALLIAAGIIGLAVSRALRFLAERAGGTGSDAGSENAQPDTPLERPASARTQTPRTPGSLPVPTRMALQMAVALAAAFVVGFAAFGHHWGWVVLTAFIVCSGARGRGDAAYKGLLRLLGAAAGTLAAAAIGALFAPRGPGEAVTIFVVVYAGLLLRDVNYAYWAGCMTLVLALLANSTGASVTALLALRLLAIIAGALCAVTAAWFVFPIRTEAVIRRRLADVLAALDAFIALADASATERASRLRHLEARIAELNAVAPPVELHRRVFGARGSGEHPAGWISRMREVNERARALSSDGSDAEPVRARVRRATGIARRAIAQHGKPDAPPDAPSIGTALERLHAALPAADLTSSDAS
jgi:hypothetical protein